MRPEELPTSAPLPYHERSVLAGVLSFIIPGLGQIAQGRIGKGLLFMVVLLSMFFFGQALGGWRNVYIPLPEDQRFAAPDGRARRLPFAGVFQRWHYAGQFFIGLAAWPALWQFYDMPMPEGEFWKTYQRGPREPHEERELNDQLVNSDKSPDVGWIYTVIAGMLNLLVIYDAYAGPAHLRPRTTTREPAAPAVGQGVTA